MKTGKALGLKKGDCVYIGPFVGSIMSDVHTATLCGDVWGFAHEMGSGFAELYRKVSVDELKKNPFYQRDPIAWSKEAKKTLR